MRRQCQYRWPVSRDGAWCFCVVIPGRIRERRAVESDPDKRAAHSRGWWWRVYVRRAQRMSRRASAQGASKFKSSTEPAENTGYSGVHRSAAALYTMAWRLQNSLQRVRSPGGVDDDELKTSSGWDCHRRAGADRPRLVDDRARDHRHAARLLGAGRL